MAFSNYSVVCLPHVNSHTNFFGTHTIGDIHGVGSFSTRSMMSSFKSFCSSALTLRRKENIINLLRCATGLTEVSLWMWTVLFASFPMPRKTLGYVRAISARNNWLMTCTNCNEQQVDYPNCDPLLPRTTWNRWFCIMFLQWTSKSHVQITSSWMFPTYVMSLLEPFVSSTGVQILLYVASSNMFTDAPVSRRKVQYVPCILRFCFGPLLLFIV